MNALLTNHEQDIIALCREFHVGRLDVFGSVLREDFGPDSDIDVVAEFGPVATGGLARQYFGFKQGMEQLLGRPVDVIELSAMQDSRLKRLIEKSRVNVYAAST
ncbi:nucleotidyltransferase domain-containing protein [Flagellatimonas centrodinii]|uniref:nucleotidyltransferase family protein n=1 Tax=Flagellatimonas centrodinii TaxID=2806210 RepID=UPI001FF07B1F|nr:nucleotidyltransferase domain-containing protein [Flagellatimonas centrodinii]ULQ46914.1 nucleotidyltransferase domain-containing protein [Flagellatimonas centrodinii]